MPGMKGSRILVLTGPGKGKTTSAFGMALRALGHGGKVAVIQFIKHDGSYGEVVALRQFPNAEVDEIFYPLNYGFISVAEVVDALKKITPGKVVVLTGRDAPEEMIAVADTVSRIECVRHAFQQGIKAQRNVEF